MTKDEILERLHRGLIVSCQAEADQGSQLTEPRDIGRIAKEVLDAGACAVRICGIENVTVTRELNPDAIIIGIIKGRYPDGNVLITPTFEDIVKLVNAGADIIGLDMTRRLRPDGTQPVVLLQRARSAFPNILFMADIANFEDAQTAIMLGGADLVATTLSGYTDYTRDRLRPNRWYEYWPDMKLVEMLVDYFWETPIIAEGRWREPRQCYVAIQEYGAWAVCVGSQITRPREQVRWHLKAIREGGWNTKLRRPRDV